MIRRLALVLVLAALAACAKAPPKAGTLILATASSFRPVAQKLVPLVAQKCGANLRISAGSTGQLTAQVLQGAPYDVFVAAGLEANQQLEKQNRLKATILLAQSPLVLWTPPAAGSSKGVLALARPGVAPYGRAAAQALEHMAGQADWMLPPGRVYGKSAAQAFAFVATGAAQAALLPRSLVLAGKVPGGQWRAVPAAWYAPVPTHALLLHRGKAAHCLWSLLQSAQMQPLLRSAGYGRP